MSEALDFQFHRERKRESKEKVDEIQLWVKGISSDNKSSWAFVYIDGKRDITFMSGESLHTGDSLQIVPVVEFLDWISGDERKRSVTVYTDSNYLVNVLKEWIDKWKKSQFKLQDGSDRPNGDLLRKVDSLRQNTTLLMKHLFSKNEFTDKVYSLCRNEIDLL